MTRRILSLLLILISFESDIFAISPEEIYDKILDNGSLDALKAELNHELYQARSENYPKGPEAEFEHLWGRNGATKWSFGVTQFFDWPGLYSIRKRIIENKNLINQYEINSLKEELKLQTVDLLVRINYLQRRIDVYKSQIKDLKELEDYLDEALEHGLVTILDKKKAIIESVNIQIDCDKLEAEKNLYIDQLSELAGTDLQEEELDVNSIVNLYELKDLETYLNELETEDCKIKIAKQASAYALLEEKESNMALYPGFGVGYRHEKEEDMHFNGFAVSLTLPNWGAGKQARASKIKTTAANLQAANIYNAQKVRVEREYNSAMKLKENISTLHENGLDGTYMVLVKEAMQGGEISMPDFLREQTFYRNTLLNLIDLEEKYSLLLTSLNRYNIVL